jgi:hypothetical protein
MVLGFEIGNGSRNGAEGKMMMKMGDNKGGTKNDRCKLSINPPNSSLPSWKLALQVIWQDQRPDQQRKWSVNVLDLND